MKIFVLVCLSVIQVFCVTDISSTQLGGLDELEEILTEMDSR